MIVRVQFYFDLSFGPGCCVLERIACLALLRELRGRSRAGVCVPASLRLQRAGSTTAATTRVKDMFASYSVLNCAEEEIEDSQDRVITTDAVATVVTAVTEAEQQQ